jgi:hypothetical protein
MTKRISWPVAIALSALLCISGAMPALARGGGGHGGRIGVTRAHRAVALVRGALFSTARFDAGSPRIGAGPLNQPGDFIRTRGVSGNVGSVVGWPYLWPLDSTPGVISLTGSDAPSTPQVIVVAGSAADAPPRSAPDPDYGYVPGCRAIPGGYHCDTQRRPATEP